MKLRLLAALATILLSASATADPGGWIVAWKSFCRSQSASSFVMSTMQL